MPSHRPDTAIRCCVLILGLLGGCTPVPPTISGSTSLPRAQAIAIEQRHIVEVSPSASTLTSEEAASLGSFLRSLPADERPRVGLHPLPGAAHAFANEPTANHAMAIVATFIERNLPQAAIDRRSDRLAPGFAAPGSSRSGPLLGKSTELAVEVTVHLLQLPACPDWSADPAYDPRNLPLSNLGCATATDLGLMLAEPADLVAGTALAPADGVQAAEAVTRYRTGKVTPLAAGSSLP